MGKIQQRKIQNAKVRNLRVRSMYRTAPIEIDPDELFKSLERRFQRTLTTQDNTIDLNPVSDVLSSLEEIHEPTGDEELTIDLDFGSNHDLSSRPDPIRSNPLVNKKPLTEAKIAPNNKSLADTVS